MEHKLRSALPPRTAWILIGICLLFWLLSGLGLLQIPASVPPLLMFFWLYLNALAALASVMAVTAAVASLLLHRRHGRLASPADGAAEPAPSALDAAEETGLDQLLSGTDPIPPPGPPAAAPAGNAPPPQAAGRPARRKRRKR